MVAKTTQICQRNMLYKSESVFHHDNIFQALKKLFIYNFKMVFTYIVACIVAGCVTCLYNIIQW